MSFFLCTRAACTSVKLLSRASVFCLLFIWKRKKEVVQRRCGCDVPQRETRSSAETLWVRHPPERNKKQCGDAVGSMSPTDKQEAVQRGCGCNVPQRETRSSAEMLWVQRPPERNKKQCRDAVGSTSPREKQEAVQRRCGCDILQRHDSVENGEHDPPPPWRMENTTPSGNHGSFLANLLCQTTDVRLPYGREKR